MMDLEKVKEHFKDAKEVKCLVDGKKHNLNVKGQYIKDINGHIDFFFELRQRGNDYVSLYVHNKLAEIISYKDYTEPEPEKSEYPKVMLVSSSQKRWEKRVVFMKKNNLFIAWNDAETIEESKTITFTTTWKYAKELSKEIKVTKEEIAKWKGCEVEQLIIK